MTEESLTILFEELFDLKPIFGKGDRVRVSLTKPFLVALEAILAFMIADDASLKRLLASCDDDAHREVIGQALMLAFHSLDALDETWKLLDLVDEAKADPLGWLLERLDESRPPDPEDLPKLLGEDR